MVGAAENASLSPPPPPASGISMNLSVGVAVRVGAMDAVGREEGDKEVEGNAVGSTLLDGTEDTEGLAEREGAGDVVGTLLGATECVGCAE